MLRTLVVLLAALAVADQAHAFSPDGATASVTDFGGRHGFAIGLSGVDTTLDGKPSDDGLTMTRMAMLGLSWSHGGFSIGASAGKMDYAQYVVPTFSVGAANLASVSISHAIVDGVGGTLAVGLSANRYYFDQGSVGLVAASVRWSLKF